MELKGSTFNYKIKDIFASVLFFVFSLTLIFIFPWQISLPVSLLILALVLINLNFALILTLLILTIPITRFPLISEYVMQLKILAFSVVLAVWFIKRDIVELRSLKNNPLTVFFVLFLILMLINIIFSVDKPLTLEAIFTHIIEFGFFYLFLDYFRDKKFLMRIFYVFIATGVFVGFVALMQYLIAEYKMFPELGRIFLPYTHRYGLTFYSLELMQVMGYRSVGTFYHPNLLGLYLSMVMPMAVAFMLVKKNAKDKLTLLPLILIMIAGIFCSGSRGAFLGALVSLCVIAVFLWKYISRIEILLFITIPVFIVLRFMEKIIYYLRIDDILSYRDLIWENALNMISRHPFAGCGLGAFHKEYMTRYGFPSLVDFQNTVRDIALTGSSEWLQGFHAHNLFLNYAAEMGIFAIPLILLFYVIFFRESLSVVKIRKEIPWGDYMMIVSSIAVIAGNFVYSFFEAATNFYNFTIGIAFVLIASMGMSLISSYKKTALKT